MMHNIRRRVYFWIICGMSIICGIASPLPDLYIASMPAKPPPSPAKEYVRMRDARSRQYIRELDARDCQPPRVQQVAQESPIIPDDQEIYEHNGEYFFNPKFRIKQEADRQRQQEKIRQQCAGALVLFREQVPHLTVCADLWKHEHPDRAYAFYETLADPIRATNQSYILSQYATCVVHTVSPLHELSVQLTGHALQHELMSEAMHGIERTAYIDQQRLSPLCAILHLHALSTLDDARKAVMIGDCIGGSQCIDFVNVLIDYVAACATGAAEAGISAVKNTVQGVYNIVVHPQETLQQLGLLAHMVAQCVYQFIPPEFELSVESYERDVEVYQYHYHRVAENWKTAIEGAWDCYQKTPGPDIARQVTRATCEIPLSIFCAHQCSSLMSKLVKIAGVPHAITRAKSLAHQSVSSSRIAHALVQTIEDITLTLKHDMKVTTEQLVSTLKQCFSIGDEVEVALASGETLSSEGTALLHLQPINEELEQTFRAFSTIEAFGEETFTLNFTEKTTQHMKNTKRIIPAHMLREVLNDPMFIRPDPQGTSALMHYARMWRNGKIYNVEVLYDRQRNLIMHFLFRQEPLGPLPWVT